MRNRMRRFYTNENPFFFRVACIRVIRVPLRHVVIGTQMTQMQATQIKKQI